MVITKDKSLVAVARENKSIEIWTTPQMWTQVLVIPGNQNCDIRNLHWLEPDAEPHKQQKDSNPFYYRTKQGTFKKRRLVSTGLNGVIIEWNLFTLSPKSKYNLHASIWDSKMHGKFAYLACEDGSVKIVKVKKTKIEMVRSMIKMSDSKSLSIELIISQKAREDEKALVE